MFIYRTRGFLRCNCQNEVRAEVSPCQRTWFIITPTRFFVNNPLNHVQKSAFCTKYFSRRCSLSTFSTNPSVEMNKNIEKKRRVSRASEWFSASAGAEYGIPYRAPTFAGIPCPAKTHPAAPRQVPLTCSNRCGKRCTEEVHYEDAGTTKTYSH